ncbi:hypothetical protein ND486_20790 [Pseudonocardia sp. DR1-2]|uniref:hypothetical protein n=1 Tax=Pseudonocardia sp. DR1-2 TaxID=2951168 RepID=UPI0020433557|nr:hypothetical protein [Pseudonocardia sp. DR1-2]MCM3848629.1 hypothetical protein [Pseudonocardia sp. DR1-2]
MLVLVLILVVIALVLLLAGWFLHVVALAWTSVVISLIAGLVLAYDWWQTRAAVKAGDRAEADASGRGTGAPAAPDRADRADMEARYGADMEPATQVLPVVRPDGGAASGTPGAAQNATDQTIQMPVVRPSGSAEGPPGASRSGGLSSRTVTESGAEDAADPSGVAASHAGAPAGPDASAGADGEGGAGRGGDPARSGPAEPGTAEPPAEATTRATDSRPTGTGAAGTTSAVTAAAAGAVAAGTAGAVAAGRDGGSGSDPAARSGAHDGADDPGFGSGSGTGSGADGTGGAGTGTPPAAGSDRPDSPEGRSGPSDATTATRTPGTAETTTADAAPGTADATTATRTPGSADATTVTRAAGAPGGPAGAGSPSGADHPDAAVTAGAAAAGSGAPADDTRAGTPAGTPAGAGADTNGTPADTVGSDAPAGTDGDSPEEPRDPTLAALAARLPDEVLVIDEHPRYHVQTCRALTGRPVIPLPVSEAVELGFTPCGWCAPNRTLGDRHPAQAR